MLATKTKISVTVSKDLALFLEESARNENTSKSALVESALQKMVNQRLVQDAKAIAKATFDDLPTEDEWLAIQSEIDHL